MQDFKVLDHGFIRVVDKMGSDASVVQAARVSYGDGTKTPSDDQKLINYLWRNKHTSPFEMCEIKLHVKLPIFVARQWVRHRTANINEYSARYSVMKEAYYIPAPFHQQGKINKQGSGDVHPQSAEWQVEFADLCERAYRTYELALHAGVSREEARIILPVNFYTEWYWKNDLSNLLKFCTLRSDEHAQYEIRQYSDALLKIVEEWCPMVYSAYKKYKFNATES